MELDLDSVLMLIILFLQIIIIVLGRIKELKVTDPKKVKAIRDIMESSNMTYRETTNFIDFLDLKYPDFNYQNKSLYEIIKGLPIKW